MKKIILFGLLSLLMLGKSFSQSYPPRAIMYGSSPFQDSAWAWHFDDLTPGRPPFAYGPTLAGFTITGMNSMAYDPCGFQIYVIMKVSGITGRVLGTFDPATGICTQIGNLGDKFSSLTFGPNGQLYGSTGNGTVSEGLYAIDKTNANATLLTLMGNGADGEIICFNPGDNNIYHWSGNGTVVYEKMAPPYTPYAPVNIPIVGTTSGETFGALYLGADSFLTSNISSSWNIFTTGGTVSPAFGSNPDDIRGLALPPVFATDRDTVCPKYDTVRVGSDATYLYSKIYYNWGDGHIDTVSSGGTWHVYTASGNRTLTATLDNGTCSGVYWTKTIVVKTSPSVTISGSGALCPSGSVLLTGTSGGTSQWYLNGSVIGGATTNTYTVTAPGSYNMVKTNLNGCYDSAATAKVVVSVPNPTVALGNDITQCAGTATLDAGNAGSTYLWSDASTGQTLVASTTNTYAVTVTDVNTCTGTDAIDVTINPLPVVALGNDITQCGGTATLDAANAGSTYVWSNTASTQSITVSSSATYSVTVTDANTCTGTDAIDVTINPLPVVALGNDVTQCGGTVTLDAANAGATYLWSNSSSTQTITVASGTYSVTVTDANTCTGSDAITVTINTIPTVALGNDFTQCGGTATLDAGNAGSTYAWSNSSGSQTITVSASGTYTVTVTDANTCSNTDAITVTINPLPVVALGNDITQCGGTATLDAGNAGSTYVWSNSSSTQTITVSTSGTYTVTVTNASTCTAADAITVTINGVPNVALGNDVTQCGGSVTLDAGNAGSTFAWSNSSGSQTITVNTSGTYTVTVTNASTCTGTDAVVVTINTIPTAALTLASDSACSNSSAIALSGGSPAGGSYFGSGVTGGNFTPGAVGNYTISYAYTDNHGCSDTASASIVVYQCVGINELTSGSINLYPNPAKDFVTLNATGLSGALEIQIFDESGRVVVNYRDAVNTTDYKHTFDLSKLAAGNYILKANTANGTATYQLVVR